MESPFSPEGAAPEGSLAREGRRKAWHLLLAAYVPAYHWLGAEDMMRAMLLWTAVVLAVETARLRVPAVHRLLQSLFGGIVREKEARRFTGTLYSTLGVLGALAVCGDRAEAFAAAVLYLAIADAAAALAGKAWGRTRFRVLGQERTLEGAAAGAAAALLCGAAAGLPPRACLAGALAFSAADLTPLPPDDNLWIPLFSGWVLSWVSA